MPGKILRKKIMKKVVFRTPPFIIPASIRTFTKMIKNTIDTIYEDDSIVAVNKPAGISVGADRLGKANLADLLQKQRKDDKKLRVIHHLDKEASGIIVLAKTAESQKKMSQLFDTGQAKMVYLALVNSTMGEEQTGIVDEPISEDHKHQQRMQIDPENGTPAQTKWQKLANFGGISLLAIEPLTHISHPHQIQVHLQHCGMGLVIDPLYGQNDAIMLSSFKHGYRLAKYEVEKPLIERLTLCAYQLEIENYKNGEKLNLVAPLEKKFRATVKMLTKYNNSGQEAFDNPENFNHLVNGERICLKED
jgi:23S rRNA pseudouridine1911/1915/1917 synthase